ncbi:unnamed protein product [Brachionus calyciflorus]|uniref:Uncharacterized protein n=1 Tax=Brachionus calyciflorus TaxID=104777 RepID=A0A814S8K8_9BILA|nr:unnamed protein product [Brachionus calyciflorus]
MCQNGLSHRIYGKCTRYCVSNSLVFRIKSLASHRVLLQFKHWLIILDVICPSHGIQQWCLEKICPCWSDMTVGLQVLQNYSIWMSCSTYSHYLVFKKCKHLHQYYFLSLIARYLMSLNLNGYNLINDNCGTFNRKIWNELDFVTF